ncbi:enoyl-CoA hydratase/isomerase family protein [Kribbella sp. NPDC056861]|uniref:enoyl-CoA hydratase/isomerase family protein n=1 Tax=Kribbella sp. NPDC056861 TaxID=3154857 RepID=UPI00344416D1
MTDLTSVTLRSLQRLYTDIAVQHGGGRDGASREDSTLRNLVELSRLTRDSVLSEHAASVYEQLTEGFQRSYRVIELVLRAAEQFPGLLPDRGYLENEQRRPQRNKIGLEYDHGLFVSWILADPTCGHHLLHAMTLPHPAAAGALQRLRDYDSVDLGTVQVRRRGIVGEVVLGNHRFLNAEDDRSLRALELAVDLVLLDDRIEIGVLRGGEATHPKYAGNRVFSSGLNLTDLYEGRISFTAFFLERELGLLNKLLRGHPTGSPHRELEQRREKPWISVVDAFAIGSGVQLLLATDYVIAEQAAYFSLPAARIGVLSGTAGLRLARLLGDSPAREALTTGRAYPVESSAGRLLMNRVVAPDQMDSAIAAAVFDHTSSGRTATRATRRELRSASEPADDLRRFLATYARDQAECVFDPGLLSNLDNHSHHPVRVNRTA